MQDQTNDSEEYADGDQHDEIPTIAPEKEPEYVGVHSGCEKDRCTAWEGETRDDVSRCERDATHTLVMYDGSLKEMSVCDEHGEPDALPRVEKEWSA